MSRADPLRIADYLQHILEANNNIQDYTAGMDLAAYMADGKTRDAVIRNLEVIGETCNNITKHHPEFAAKHSAIPWGSRMRCAMRFHMATSRLTTRSFGRPFSRTCRNYGLRSPG